MKKTLLILLTFSGLTGLVILQSCKKDDPTKGYKTDRQLVLPDEPYDYHDVTIPDHVLNSNFFSNLTDPGYTNDGATLGRVLFYDTRLSLSNEVSCSSCHLQELGFSDGKALSDGVTNHQTPRNSQAIINCITEHTFFWDSRVDDLNQMVRQPIKNHNELGMESMGDLTVKLETVSYYPPLFEKAFGSPDITEDGIASALEQFLLSMMSFDAKIDQVYIQNNTDLLTDQQNRGFQIFNNKAKCASCHGGADFRGSWGEDWANIGLDPETTDEGIQQGAFKVPSLRNIAVTAPYMHDGRFETLMEVIDHYNEGVEDHPNLDWRLQGNDGEPQKLNLTQIEKEDLIAFLHTLTDHNFLQDVRYSDPFK